jgi:two-component system chemotaxis response regulator CheY
VSLVRGCEAICFIHPVEALKYLRTNNVDLIILDINMPIMSGRAFVDNVFKMELSSMPSIMMCSADSSSDTILEFMGRGVSGYVVKPYDGETLKKQIRHIRNKTRPELIPANEMWSVASTS